MAGFRADGSTMALLLSHLVGDRASVRPPLPSLAPPPRNEGRGRRTWRRLNKEREEIGRRRRTTASAHRRRPRPLRACIVHVFCLSWCFSLQRMRGLHLVEYTHIFDLLEPRIRRSWCWRMHRGRPISRASPRFMSCPLKISRRTGSSTGRSAGRMVCRAPTDFLIRALHDLRKMLDEGKELGMPDGVLINGKGPYRYNNSLVPTGIEHETIDVYPVEGVHSGRPEAYEFKIGDQFFRRPVDPPLDQVIAMLQKHKDKS